MINFRPIFQVIGIMLTILSATMLIPAGIDLLNDHTNWHGFLESAFLTSFCGIALYLSNRTSKTQRLNVKQAFVLTTMLWVSIVFFAAMPFFFADEGFSFTDSFFEAMSALTTTGATMITNLEEQSRGILFWRSLLQWMGGIGIIVMAMAILPLLKIGGMQLFRAESSDNAEKTLPRARQVASAISGLYLTLTLVCGLLLWLAGMTPFDAINHAMTSVATAGFSTHDASIGYFDNVKIEIIIMFFMVLSGVPFMLYVQFVRGRIQPLFRDTQVRWYLTMLAVSVLAVTIWLMHEYGITWTRALRMASFNTISVATTTGYATQDYYVWGSFVVLFFYMLAVVGGCTGSTSGGIKVFRFQVLFETAKAQVNQLVQPHGVFKPTYNRKPITDQATASVMAFIILFGACFSVLAMLLSFTGLDYITSMSAAGSMMANLGPGLGPIIGPAGSYAPLPDAAKWLCAAGMLIGRLEIFTVLILFSRYFWRN